MDEVKPARGPVLDVAGKRQAGSISRSCPPGVEPLLARIDLRCSQHWRSDPCVAVSGCLKYLRTPTEASSAMPRDWRYEFRRCCHQAIRVVFSQVKARFALQV